MKIGIICAMEEELAPLKKIMSMKESRTKARMEFIEGTLEEKDVVMVISGIGKVNAAVCAQILADDYHVTHLINVGVAGGVKENIQPMDVVVAPDWHWRDPEKTRVIPRMKASSSAEISSSPARRRSKIFWKPLMQRPARWKALPSPRQLISITFHFQSYEPFRTMPIPVQAWTMKSSKT